LLLAEAVVKKIESGDVHAGIERARMINRRWLEQQPSRLHKEWSTILSGEWPAIRSCLLNDSERGAELRQNNPFCGILSPRERWKIFREFPSCEA
jgi:hypothetical protein